MTLTRVASLPVEPVRQQGGGDSFPGFIGTRCAWNCAAATSRFATICSELEDAPWRFSWRSLNYHVEQFPNATVVLELETMSREKNWLGV